MTDTALIFYYLSNHPGWNNVIRIMDDLKPKAKNWAVRSRISDFNLRRVSKKISKEIDNWIIESRRGENGCEDYRLIRIRPQKNLPVEIVTLSSKKVEESYTTRFDGEGQGVML